MFNSTVEKLIVLSSACFRTHSDFHFPIKNHFPRCKTTRPGQPELPQQQTRLPAHDTALVLFRAPTPCIIGSSAAQALSGQCAPLLSPFLPLATHNLLIASQVQSPEKKKQLTAGISSVFFTSWTKSRTSSFNLYQNLFLSQGTAYMQLSFALWRSFVNFILNTG